MNELLNITDVWQTKSIRYMLDFFSLFLFNKSSIKTIFDYMQNFV